MTFVRVSKLTAPFLFFLHLLYFLVNLASGPNVPANVLNQGWFIFMRLILTKTRFLITTCSHCQIHWGTLSYLQTKAHWEPQWSDKKVKPDKFPLEIDFSLKTIGTFADWFEDVFPFPTKWLFFLVQQAKMETSEAKFEVSEGFAV
jgi:hypothetical protein